MGGGNDLIDLQGTPLRSVRTALDPLAASIAPPSPAIALLGAPMRPWAGISVLAPVI
jgi:hypothetical protein